MNNERLAIPLNTNPARQKLWRAVGLLGLVIGAVIFGYLLDRAVYYRTSPQRWPAEAALELRLIKTPRTTRLVTQGFTNVQALPGTPWSLPEALSWSKREFVVYADDTHVIGLVIDGKLPDDVRSSLPDWGWSVLPVGRRSLIIATSASEPLPIARHVNLWLTLPMFDGTMTVKAADHGLHGLPFRFSSASSLDVPINMQAFIPHSALSLSSDTKLAGSFALPASEAQAFLPASVPATFPGLQSLSTQAANHSLDILLGEDAQGQAFALSVPVASLSPEQLGVIATEGASLQSLSTTALTSPGLPPSTEIRSDDKISLNISKVNGLDVAVAETTDHHLLRLTQSDTQLIVSNRNPIIGLESATYTGSCLPHPQGFLFPDELATGLPGLIDSLNGDIFGYLLHAKEIAYKKNWLRICW